MTRPIFTRDDCLKSSHESQSLTKLYRKFPGVLYNLGRNFGKGSKNNFSTAAMTEHSVFTQIELKKWDYPASH